MPRTVLAGHCPRRSVLVNHPELQKAGPTFDGTHRPFCFGGAAGFLGRLGEIERTDLGAAPRLGIDGRLQFRFGGRLQVTGSADGDYRGRIPVTVEYQ